jgi:long-chain acyl-CoA synthetase
VGELVCLAVELRADAVLSLGDVQAWMRTRVTPAKVPKALVCVGALPRNVMGKKDRQAGRGGLIL